MKKALIVLTAGSMLVSAVAAPAFAARKKCEAGTFWSSKARACVRAGASRLGHDRFGYSGSRERIARNPGAGGGGFGRPQENPRFRMRSTARA